MPGFQDKANMASMKSDRSVIWTSLVRISYWGDSNRVQFSATNTDSFVVYRKSVLPRPDLIFNGAHIKCSSSWNVLGLTIDSSFTWKEHIHGITAVASRKVGLIISVRSYFSSTQPLELYKSLFRPHMENFFHVWAGTIVCHFECLNKIKGRATKCINDANLTIKLDPFNARCRVASLSLFQRYNVYFANSVAGLMSHSAEIGRRLVVILKKKDWMKLCNDIISPKPYHNFYAMLNMIKLIWFIFSVLLL